MAATTEDRNRFSKTVLEYYQRAGRHNLPWRMPEPNGAFDPYKILVSEIMLQQTQVPRVIPKFTAFLERFPTVQSLAIAPLGDVLVAWQGLGYNRRAKFLWQAAQMVHSEHKGILPNDQIALEGLPGIGRNTAGAIRAYTFNEPVIFVETNIRTVFIHHFFTHEAAVSDAAIRELVVATLDRGNPRIWYWALMDYGAYIKSHEGNTARSSKSYTKQSKFEGSQRQVRGHIVRLLAKGPMTSRDLYGALADPRVDHLLTALAVEGLVVRRGAYYCLP